LEALRDEDYLVRSSAAEALGKLGKPTDEVITGLLEALRDEHSVVRSGAAEALGKLGKPTDEVITGLLEALRDEDYLVRSSAAEALGKLGKPTDEVITGLLEALRDEDYLVRSSAAEALKTLRKRAHYCPLRKGKLIQLPKFLTVKELSRVMDVSLIDVIKELMVSGVMANINQVIDFETAAIVAKEMGFEVKPIKWSKPTLADKPD
jgi:3-methyladenine DNA glycosylase AlkD